MDDTRLVSLLGVSLFSGAVAHRSRESAVQSACHRRVAADGARGVVQELQTRFDDSGGEPGSNTRADWTGQIDWHEHQGSFACPAWLLAASNAFLEHKQKLI
jgi:hypothetical protein